MLAKDIFHDSVKCALEKEGWTITDDPLFLRFGGLEMYIDLGAERIFAAERNNERIAVEVKSFIAPSAATEFSMALGQFLKYQLALSRQLELNVRYQGCLNQSLCQPLYASL
jgi:hypothetical protein